MAKYERTIFLTAPVAATVLAYLNYLVAKVIAGPTSELPYWTSCATFFCSGLGWLFGSAIGHRLGEGRGDATFDQVIGGVICAVLGASLWFIAALAA